MSRMLAMAFPIPQGNENEWQQFMKDLKDKWLEDFQASRRTLGVRERTFLQQTPMGQLVLVTLEGEDPERALQEFPKGTDAFTKWFVERVKTIHGFDLANPPEGPMPSLIIDSGPVMESSTARSMVH
jgi:hypothetical protein